MIWMVIALSTALLISIVAHLIHYYKLRWKIDRLQEHTDFQAGVIAFQYKYHEHFSAIQMTTLDFGTDEPPAVVQQKLRAWHEGLPALLNGER